MDDGDRQSQHQVEWRMTIGYPFLTGGMTRLASKPDRS